MLSEVLINADVLRACLLHALTTEREEVMGLLIGDVFPSGGNREELICSVRSLHILRRSDKRQDRVEISDEQLVETTQYCENLSEELGETLRVLGWYHSHPHITVWPSHVDLRTQLAYQQMDDNFIGVIFSVFNHDHQKSSQSWKLMCFQSARKADGGVARLEIKHRVTPPDPKLTPSCLAAQLQIPQVLMEEEREALEKAMARCQNEDVLSLRHNACAYHNKVCRILEAMVWPMLQDMELELDQLRQTKEDLEKERDSLVAADSTSE